MLRRAHVRRPSKGPSNLIARWSTFLLPLILIVLAVLMFVLLIHVQKILWFSTNVILLATYGLAPFVVALDVLLLFGGIARRIGEISQPPQRLWLRMVQWVYGGLLLLEAAANAPVTVSRILVELGLYRQPSPKSYLPDGWQVVLRPTWRVIAAATSPVMWIATIVLAGYAVAILRRARAATAG
jgi:hypothetical protein